MSNKTEESTSENRNNSRQVAGVILAAGASSRFGSDKRQSVGPSGEPMLHTVLATYRQWFDTLLVVIPVNDEFGFTACAKFSALALPNVNSAEGMGSSLRVAAAWLQQNPSIRACVIGLADMPLIRPETVRDIRDLVARHAKPVVACTQTQLGFPRALPQNYFSLLSQLQGDVGARSAVDWSAAMKLLVEDSSVLLDIDTPQDQTRWIG